jgi:hypothetical protein
MDLFVELPDGTSKHVPVSLNCSVRAATQSCVLRAGMTPVASKLTEFSLAKKTDNQNPIIDVCWLDEGEKIKDQGGDSGSLNLILLKKYYATNSDLGLLVSSSVLLRNLYSQFRRSYVSGLYRCTQSEAAQLSALIARAEFSLSELRPGSLQKTGRLEAIVPSFHYTSAGIEQDILKALSSVANLTETKAQEQFVHLVSKLDTFGLSLHTIMLVEIGGERREALFGVGPQHIRVMETHNLKTLMQWKTKDLTNHSFNDTTFSMNCGSESITMVTKQGHMISAYLSGMTSQQSPAPSKGSPPKKPLRPQRSVAAIMENGHGDGLSDRTSSTHIKSVDQQVKRYEGHLNKPRPLDPASQGPRPFRPPRPRHAPLRVTQSVPIRYTKPPTPTTSPSPLPAAGSREGERKPGTVYEVPFRKPRQGGGGGKPESPPQVPRVEEARYEVGNNKEVPPQPLGRLRKKNEEKGKPLAAGGDKIDVKRNPPHLPVLEEALYETTAIEEELPQPKVRPLLPPPPHNRKQLLKKKLLPAGLPNPDSNPPPPVVPPHAKKTHKSETEITVESGRDERPHSPVYDQPIQPPEYSEPEITTASSHGRAPKGKPGVLHFPQPPSPFSPPPPSSPAPPPPHPHSSAETSQTPPPPKTPAPEPPIYDTLTPEEDMQEIEDVFGSKDLPMKVKYSCDTNPIYDTLAATELTSALNASNVTYHSFRNTLERRRSQQKPNVNQQKNKKKLPKARSQPQVISSPIPLSSSPPLPPSPHDYANSELLSLLMKDMSPRASPTGQEESEPRREKPRKKSPSPPLTKAKSVSQIGVGGAKSGEKPLSVKPTPSCGYSRLEHFQNKPGVVPPPQTGPEPNRSGTTTDDDDEHEYAEVDQNPQRKTKLTKKLSDFEKASWVPVQNGGSSTPPPIPPLRGSDWEGKKLGPPKPPRARQRWEKKVERGSEGKSHKAVKRTDALRDYSSLMKDFRMFHVKLPTGIIHTDMANVRSEVGKLVRRLCVLLRVEEADYDHFSLYVEGTPYTILPEMTEEDGDEGGMFRRLRQKSPSRQDLFGSNRSFAVLSERSTNPILLDPSISFKSQGITTSRILALRPQTVLQGKMTRFQIRVPDWVRFHQCWLSTVQGTIVTTQTEAIKVGIHTFLDPRLPYFTAPPLYVYTLLLSPYRYNANIVGSSTIPGLLQGQD